MNKRMMINGFRAEVLSDGWTVGFRKAGTLKCRVAVPDQAESVKSAQRAALLAQAEREGFDWVTIDRFIYATYDLRFVMKSRSAKINYHAEYRLVDGRWVEKKSTTQNCY